jgi:ribosome-associated protein
MGKTASKPKPSVPTTSAPATKKRTATRKSPLEKKSPQKKPLTKRPARTPRVKTSDDDPIKQAALKAAQYAIEKKAEQVRLLDLRNVTSMTDFFVIATGPSQPQVKAIAENVIKEMRDTEGMAPWRSEGWDSLEWVLIDFVDFVVHIFQPTARQYYNVERLWGDAPAIDVEDTAAKPKRRAKKATDEPGATAKTTANARSRGVRVISDFKEVKK